jgi:hypothetical protein
MGELVVCPQCEAVFGWRDRAPVDLPRDAAAGDLDEGDVKP